MTRGAVAITDIGQFRAVLFAYILSIPATGMKCTPGRQV
jgi:hypothetical protein